MKKSICISLALLLIGVVQLAIALPLGGPNKNIPQNALKYLPLVNEAIDDLWPALSMRSYVAAQIEQESCISVTHSKCWNPRAELKTSREYGVGMGQLTIAYDKKHKVRFNAWAEIKEKDPSLKNWQWADRYNPLLQIKAIVIKNRINYSKITWKTHSDLNKMAFLAAFYNSGSPGKDRQLCLSRPNCDSERWLVDKTDKPYAVESYSTKAKKPVKGYSKSFFQISREYPRNVLFLRRQKYISYMKGS